jgi:hypothetical protein
MTDKKDETAERVAALERELADLKSAVKAAPAPYDPVEAERSAAKFRDEMRALSEARASVIPPWLREACAGGVTAADCADLARAAHAPTGPSSAGAIPSSQQVTGVHPHGGPLPQLTPGWGYSPPLSNPPGTGPGSAADRIVDEFDRRDRAELIERDAKLKAMQKMAEQTEAMKK